MEIIFQQHTTLDLYHPKEDRIDGAQIVPSSLINNKVVDPNPVFLGHPYPDPLSTKRPM